MQQIDDSKRLVKNLDERERQSLNRIKEAQDLIEQNRRLVEQSRARSLELAAAIRRANNRT